MEKLKNKNTIILILSAVLIVASVIIAVTAIHSSKKSSDKSQDVGTSTSSAQLDLAELASKNSNNSPTVQTATTGKYKVSGSGDPLNLRIGPDVKTDIITYVDSGTEVEVIAVWEDWGYVIYEKSGGWLSMNYLEPVGVSARVAETAEKTS